MKKADVRIELFLRFHNEYSIGGGKGLGHVQGYLLRDNFNRPYIPASLLKGNISHNARALVSSCFFSDADVNLLFGREGLENGALYFDNAILTGDASENPLHLTNMRTGVMINRYTKTQQDASLRTIETGGYGGSMLYRGEIQGFLSKYKPNTALLAASIRMMYAIGSGRSRGLGWLVDDEEKFKVYVNDELIPDKEIREWAEVKE